MNYRINTYGIWALAILFLTAAGIFTYTLIRTPTGTDETSGAEDVPPVATTEETITAKHRYAENMHTIAGMVSVPTPCHSVTVEPFFVPSEGATTTVELRFTTVLEGSDCPALVSDAPFRVTFEGPEYADLRATWNGAPARLNLIPASPDESLEMEYFFKG